MAPYPSVAGELSFYNIASGRKPFFKSGNLASKKALIFVGGLTDGIGSVAYAPKLSQAMADAGWMLVQPQWSGAYEGFGTGSLDRDVEEVESLVKLLREDGMDKIVFMGHSTGSQDVMHYLLSKSRAKIDGGIMQAPVSDRQCFATSDEIREMAKVATEMCKNGKKEELMPPGHEKLIGCRMTAYRAWSLLAEDGDDEYFSSELPDYPDPARPNIRAFSETFGKLLSSTPVLALYSAEDECATAVKDKAGLLARWEKIAGPVLTTRLVPGAGHAVEQPEAQVVLCEMAVDWLKEKVEKA